MNFFDEIICVKGETQNPKLWKISCKLNLLKKIHGHSVC